MRLSRTILLPDLLPKAVSIINRPKQLIPITHKNSGNGPIYCMAFRNMQKVIIDGLQEHCCPEVFLPTPQDIAKVGYRPCESDVALQFMQNSTWTFPQRFFCQDSTSLTAYSFSETEEEMLQQTHEMMEAFKEIFQKLELQTSKIKESEDSILFQEFHLLISAKILGKSSPDYEAFVTKKQKLSCYVVKYELDYQNVMDAIICNNTGISSFIWPKAIAPFKVLLVCSPDQMEYATGIYEKLLEKGISVLFDDRDIPLAEKIEWAKQFGIYETINLDYIDDMSHFVM